MVRGSHWWNEPPLWAWIVMVVGSVALAVLLPLGLHRTAPQGEAAVPRPEATPTPSATSAPPSAAAAPSPDAPVARVVVIGDGYTSGTAEGGLGPDGWPALLEDRLGDADVPVDVDVAADVGAGFVATGAAGLTFGELAGTADLAAADMVIVLGSRDDGPGISDQVSAAAGDLLATVGERAPEAALVVVGPVWPEDPAPAGSRNNRDVIREAAAAAGATFVDPIEDAWLVDEPDLLGADGVYPTDAGHAYLADRLEPAVRSALGG